MIAKPTLKVTTKAMSKVLTTDATAISSTLNKPFVASLIVCSALRPSPNPWVLRTNSRQMFEMISHSEHLSFCFLPAFSVFFPAFSALNPSYSVFFPAFSSLNPSYSAFFPAFSAIFSPYSALFPAFSAIFPPYSAPLFFNSFFLEIGSEIVFTSSELISTSSELISTSVECLKMGFSV